MARLIDADRFEMSISEHRYKYFHKKDVIEAIKNEPTVDAVEVVRCRDCKHSTLPSLITQRYGVPGTLTCHNHNSPCNKRNVKGECFCPYGK